MAFIGIAAFLAILVESIPDSAEVRGCRQANESPEAMRLPGGQ